ncbi:NAD-dependent epimerase/dehydratase family protein [Thermomonas brevis]|uniref:NAD-dependent epimerase/dehydratase family protein n=1 Tax=Thermomonas brevis TaxID=215691 RepID=A0A7G9QX17_9GAMM|nr:NAD-dependent epimerase/dehydratase family protein [Thermomonas brevis]QNN47892.1 NAD-dependent epimerase/dehydratase family protein [Thermomonas brevis]
MTSALVFGGSGQIGAALLERLRGAGWNVHALSRQPRDDTTGVRWLHGDFAHMPPLPDAVDAIFSCGPLDQFARWHVQAGIRCPRVVAFGSTSVHVKQDSGDAGERDVARRLREAEALLFAVGQERGVAATVLRPTLVYGAGRDATLTRIARMARRFGRFALPGGADGLRQPVHVEDLADAALAAAPLPATHGRAYDLPGGETLPYREMIRRVLACQSPPLRLHALPMPLFRALLAAARARGIARDLTDDAIARMRDDLTFDAEPARRDFGYAPRAFAPDARMFGES